MTLAGVSQAQIVIGSGRASGMGRAGLAVPYDWNASGRLNPAIYGLLPSQFRFSVPGIAYRFQGLSFDDLRTYSGNINNGGLDPNQLSNLARDLGDENVEFGLGLSGSFFMSGFALDFSGEGLAATRPNASLQAWSGSGANGAPPADAQLDAYGVAGHETGFAYGRRIRLDGVPDASLGVRVKFVKSYYTHQFVDATAIANNSGSSLGSEMGGQQVLSRDSAGVDLGIILSSSKTDGFPTRRSSDLAQRLITLSLLKPALPPPCRIMSLAPKLFGHTHAPSTPGSDISSQTDLCLRPIFTTSLMAAGPTNSDLDLSI